MKHVYMVIFSLMSFYGFFFLVNKIGDGWWGIPTVALVGLFLVVINKAMWEVD